MLEMGYPPHLIDLLAGLYRKQKAKVRTAGRPIQSEGFKILNSTQLKFIDNDNVDNVAESESQTMMHLPPY